MDPRYQEVLDISLKPLFYIGMNPLRPVYKSIVIYQLLSFLIVLILAYAQIGRSEMGYQLVGTILEVTFMLLQSTVKLVTLVVSRKEARHLITSMEKFLLPTNKNPKIEERNMKMLYIFKFVGRAFYALTYSTLVSFLLRPILFNTLSMKCHVPPYIPYWLFALFNSLTLIFCAVDVIWFDALIGSILLLLYFQFKMLNDKFSAIDFRQVHDKQSAEKVEEELKVIVDHHNFLYRYLDDFNSFIRVTALIQCFLTIFSVCFELFLIFRNNDPKEIPNNILYLLTMSSELMIAFGWPSVFVTSEANKIIWTVYKSTWQDCTYLPVRRHLIIIMQRAQKEALVSAGKMVIINLENCIRIYRAAFSFFTLMNNLL